MTSNNGLPKNFRKVGIRDNVRWVFLFWLRAYFMHKNYVCFSFDKGKFLFQGVFQRCNIEDILSHCHIF